MARHPHTSCVRAALAICVLAVVFTLTGSAHAKDKPLDYKQRSNLKDATYYLDQVLAKKEVLKA